MTVDRTRWCGPHCDGGHCSRCHAGTTGAHDAPPVVERRATRTQTPASPSRTPRPAAERDTNLQLVTR